MMRTSSFLLLFWIVFCAEVQHAIATTPESCQGRCGDRWNGWCGCHSDCRRRNYCCEDFQTTCPDEYQQFIPTPCDPRDDVPDNETECSLCQSTDGIPDDLIKCESCENRCRGVIRRPKVKCSCDAFCGFYGDCCEDFQNLCPEVFQEYLNLSELYAPEDFRCVSFDYSGLDYLGDLMITRCSPDGSECQFSRQMNEDVNSFLPMYDVQKGVHYISGYCAMCN